MPQPFLRIYTFVFSLLLSSGIGGHLFAQSYEIKPLKIGKGMEQVFATDYYDSLLFFCSNAKSKQVKNVVNEDNTRFLNLYQISLDQNYLPEKKIKPEILSENINSYLNEGPISFSKNTGEALFSSNLVSDSTQVSLVLYSSNYDKNSNTFSHRQKIELNLGDGNYSNPTTTQDGKQMIFSFTSLTDTNSNLYITTREANSWSKPQPLLDINTLYNETFPRLCGNTLYFVSDRPGGLGGLDIYKCNLINGELSEPTLLPTPINSAFDDFLFFEVSSNEGFFSSNRQNGIDRIYKFKRDLPNPSNFEESSLDFCYTFQDEIILDKKKYDYMWRFGDGTEKNGGIVEHCYKDTGVYEISCHLMDIESLEIEENIISGVIEVVAKYPIIEQKELGNGKVEIFLEQKWSRTSFTNHYWIIDGAIITDQTIELILSDSKPNTVKAVLWNTDEPENVVGITKTIIVE